MVAQDEPISGQQSIGHGIARDFDSYAMAAPDDPEGQALDIRGKSRYETQFATVVAHATETEDTAQPCAAK